MPKQTDQPEMAKLNNSASPQLLAYYAPVQQQEEISSDAPAVPLVHYLWILRRHLWKIVTFIGVCVLAAAIVSARLQPIYESTATIDVDRQAPSEVVGQGSTRTNAPNDSDQFLATQMKLIQSDAVLRPASEQLHLLDREERTKKLDPVKAQEMAKTPVRLKQLKVSRPPNTYLLLISYRSPDRNLAADAANAIANSYLAHTYTIRIRSSASMASFMEKQLGELKAKMERSGLALSKFEKDLNVINPEEKTNILAARLLQLNTEYTTAQADRVRKEAALNGLESGPLEAVQVSSQGEALARLSDTLNQVRQRFALVRSTYGATHPEYRKAASELAEVQRQFDATRENISERISVEYRESLNREQMLQKAVAETKAEWDRLNSRSFEYQQLKREADADKTLYDELIKKIRESDINAGFQNNNVRIADVARPGSRPVSPNIRLNILLTLIFSTLIAVGAAFLQASLDTTLRDPAEASRFLGVDVIGIIPTDHNSALLPKTMASPTEEFILAKTVSSRNGHGKGPYHSTSEFDEAVRTLRNTILLSDFEGRLRSIVITSATPSEGKSTIAAHLAIANADRGKKTLLVDSDLRRPSLHTKFGLSPRVGLSNVLTGELLWKEVVIRVQGAPNLNLLPSGMGSHRAADLIGPRLATLLDEFAKDYDLVILDSPPLLGFAECLQMSTAADGVLMVSMAGNTKRKTVAAAIATLQRLRVNMIGVVLNQMNHHTSADGYSYYYGKNYAEYYKLANS